MLWTLAVRSLIANRGRSALVVVSLALSSLVLVVGACLATSVRSNVEAGLKRAFVGDLQVYDAGNAPLPFIAEVPADFAPIEEPGAARRTLMQDADVVGVIPRSSASGIVVVDASSAPAVLIGIDAVAEADTLRWLSRGSGFGGARGILLGAPMAARLRRQGGDGKVTVLIPTADGLFSGDVFEIAGVYAPPGLPLVDEFLAFVPLERLQELLGTTGRPGSLVVRLREGADLQAAQARLRGALRRAGLGVEVWTWKDLAGDLLGMAQMGQYMMEAGFLFVLVVVALGVGNIFLVLMLEKIPKVGLMRAIGTPRLRVVGILLVEVTLLSALSSAAGAMAGGLLCAVLGRVGIPAVSHAMTYAFGGERLFPVVHSWELLFGFLVVTSVGPLAAIWPAVRASAANPAEVMKAPA